MTQTQRLTLTLIVAWVLLSGIWKSQFIVLGIISIAIVIWLSLHMGVLTHRGEPIYFRFFAIVRYWAWLMKQIFISNVDVTRRIWSRDMHIKPAIRRIEPSPYTELGRVIYANSITLTPGTTAINFTPEGEVVVHALHEDALEELEGGEMARHVTITEPVLKPGEAAVIEVPDDMVEPSVDVMQAVDTNRGDGGPGDDGSDNDRSGEGRGRAARHDRPDTGTGEDD
ncbi:MAG: hypothetical protein CSB44_03945 [Gammaproteobacteria bacterium]|nr:MAG: hypothetical protein CSB44_03945 [Gammaproteobacteria bacterium]PIE37470.1 MAG: hypothetical protein CSA54_01305 [Gammaproteobacteria bacterium]